MQRLGTTEIGDHFIVSFASPNSEGKPVSVRALRLLPTAFAPQMFGDWEYAACRALVRWTDEEPSLEWEQENPAEAAESWCNETGRATP